MSEGLSAVRKSKRALDVESSAEAQRPSSHNTARGHYWQSPPETQEPTFACPEGGSAPYAQMKPTVAQLGFACESRTSFHYDCASQPWLPGFAPDLFSDTAGFGSDHRADNWAPKSDVASNRLPYADHPGTNGLSAGIEQAASLNEQLSVPVLATAPGPAPAMIGQRPWLETVNKPTVTALKVATVGEPWEAVPSAHSGETTVASNSAAGSLIPTSAWQAEESQFPLSELPAAEASRGINPPLLWPATSTDFPPGTVNPAVLDLRSWTIDPALKAGHKDTPVTSELHTSGPVLERALEVTDRENESVGAQKYFLGPASMLPKDSPGTSTCASHHLRPSKIKDTGGATRRKTRPASTSMPGPFRYGQPMSRAQLGMRHLTPLDDDFRVSHPGWKSSGHPHVAKGCKKAPKTSDSGVANYWGGRDLAPGQTQREDEGGQAQAAPRIFHIPGRSSALIQSSGEWMFNGRRVPPPGFYDRVQDVFGER